MEETSPHHPKGCECVQSGLRNLAGLPRISSLPRFFLFLVVSWVNYSGKGSRLGGEGGCGLHASADAIAYDHHDFPPKPASGIITHDVGFCLGMPHLPTDSVRVSEIFIPLLSLVRRQLPRKPICPAYCGIFGNRIKKNKRGAWSLDIC